MNNLFRFFIKNVNIFLFAFLFIISIFQMINESSFHKSAYINSANAFVGNINATLTSATDYLALKRINDSLAAENAYLKGKQFNAYMHTIDSSWIVKDSVHKPIFKYTFAKVVSRTNDKINNYIIIDKGYLNGIKNGDGVVTDNGVVGTIKDVSANYSSIITVWHSKLKVGINLKNNSNFGSLEWQGYDATHAQITDVPAHVKITKGDTVYTSGSSWVYPPNLMVGKIDQFELNKGKDFYDIKVKLSADFYNLHYVYVINSFHKAEQDSLVDKFEK